MAFAVSVKTGNGGKFTTRFDTSEQALADARHQQDDGAEGVSITVAQTQEEFTVDEFAAKMAEASPS